jgi:hypothetical protein
MYRSLCALAGITAALLTAVPASAAVVTSLPGGKAQHMPYVAPYYFGPGPHTFGDGITWTAEPAGWFGQGATGHFGFGGNGNWLMGTGPVAATDGAPYLTMQFAFASPIAGFLAQMNWSPNSPATSVTAFDIHGNVLDTLLLAKDGANVATPDGYYGFRESTASIARVVFSGPYAGARSISTLAAVPEPATWGLMILGFLAVGGLLRRRVEPSPA